MDAPEFMQWRWVDLYPGDDILQVLGMISLAAPRVDYEMARLLHGLKDPQPMDVLLKMSSSELNERAKVRIKQFFDGPLLADARSGLGQVKQIMNERHRLLHALWEVPRKERLMPVTELVQVGSQEDADALMRRRGTQGTWQLRDFRKPRTVPADTLQKLTDVRANLEDAADWLRATSGTLAQALFTGVPEGAKQILDPSSIVN